MPVFNLEVDGEHVYYVAASGVLVHNSESYITELEAIEGRVAHDVDLEDKENADSLFKPEKHHPLTQSKTFFTEVLEPNVDGLTDEDLNWTVDMDKDVHQAMEKSGWWKDQLKGQIEEAVENNDGAKLTPEQVKDIANGILNDINNWNPNKPPLVVW